MPPLSGLRVVDLSSGIAGAYCTKLLADGGAEVVKVEAPSGDPLRRWSASGATIADGDDGALFNFLGASKQSVVVDPDDADDLAALHGAARRRRRRRVVARARRWPSTRRWRPPSILRGPPAPDRHVDHAVRARRARGATGRRPSSRCRRGRAAIVGLGRGAPDRAPVHVGGQIGEWLTGVYAAIGTLARRARRRRRRPGELVDVSMLEVMAIVPHLLPGHVPATSSADPMRRKRFVPTPGVGAAQRRPRRARLRHRAAVARLLRHGRPPRVDGGPVATSSTAPRSPRRSTRGSPSTRSPR